MITITVFLYDTTVAFQGEGGNSAKKINIILISVDSLRYDHLGCYGYYRHTSPNIDKLSRESVRFNQAVSPGGWTWESIPSILTGTYSYVHKVYHGYPNLINPSVKTLAQELQSGNYQTAIFSNHLALKYMDVKNGFSEVYTEQELEDYRPKITDHMLTAKIEDWLKDKGKGNPFFLYVHYWGCHHRYSSPINYRKMYSSDKHGVTKKIIPISGDNSDEGQFNGNGKIPSAVAENNIADPGYYISQYDAAVSYIDAQIGGLIDNLKKLNLYEDTLIILTADHGEMLGEHDMYFFHFGGYEENIRVPLIVRLPKPYSKRKVVATQVSLIDIAPTVLDILGLSKPLYMQGESLLSFVKPSRTYSSKYALSSCKQSLTVRTNAWKLLYNQESKYYELYNLKNDPREKYNLADKRPDIVKQFGKEITGWENSQALLGSFKKDPLPEKDKEALKGFGYMQ